MGTIMDPIEPLLEPVYSEMAAGIFADALYRILPNGRGVICRGFNEEGQMTKYGVWKANGTIKMLETRNPFFPLGVLFKMDESEGNKAFFDNGVILEL